MARALRAYPILAILVFAFTAAPSVLLGLSTDAQYASTAVVSIQPARPDVSTAAIEYLMPSVRERIIALPFAEKVRQQLPEALRDQDMAISSTVPPGSGLVRISVTSSNPDVPVPAANVYAQELVETKVTVVPVDLVLINPATDTQRVFEGPRIIVAGLGLSLILAMLAALARWSWTQSRQEPTVPDVEPVRLRVDPRDPRPYPGADARSTAASPSTQSPFSSRPR